MPSTKAAVVSALFFNSLYICQKACTTGFSNISSAKRIRHIVLIDTDSVDPDGVHALPQGGVPHMTKSRLEISGN